LAVEPILSPFQDARPLLFGGVRGLFLSVILRRWKKRQIVVAPNVSPRSAISLVRNSASVISEVSATAARMKSA
jgi:hypothetical protein